MNSKKEDLIELIHYLLNQEENELVDYWNESFHKELLEYVKPKTEVTEAGNKILNFMIENEGKKFTAKVIGEGLFLSSRSVSGAMRKLINDGFIFKENDHPITYALTEYAKQYKAEN